MTMRLIDDGGTTTTTIDENVPIDCCADGIDRHFVIVVLDCLNRHIRAPLRCCYFDRMQQRWHYRQLKKVNDDVKQPDFYGKDIENGVKDRYVCNDRVYVVVGKNIENQLEQAERTVVLWTSSLLLVVLENEKIRTHHCYR